MNQIWLYFSKSNSWNDMVKWFVEYILNSIEFKGRNKLGRNVTVFIYEEDIYIISSINLYYFIYTKLFPIEKQKDIEKIPWYLGKIIGACELTIL